MRPSHVATALAAFTVGATVTTALHRLAGRRPTAVAPAVSSPTAAPDRDAVVLPFARPVGAAAAPDQPVAPARCGDSGGLTKAGAPCAARATTGGRCHHHPIAA